MAGRYDINDARTHLSSIIDRVEYGDEVIIGRAGKPVAKVIPFIASVRRAGRGSLSGTLRFADDWDSSDTNAVIGGDFDQ